MFLITFIVFFFLFLIISFKQCVVTDLHQRRKCQLLLAQDNCIQSLIFISNEWEDASAVLSDVCMNADRMMIIRYTQLHLSLTFRKQQNGHSKWVSSKWIYCVATKRITSQHRSLSETLSVFPFYHLLWSFYFSMMQYVEDMKLVGVRRSGWRRWRQMIRCEKPWKEKKSNSVTPSHWMFGLTKLMDFSYWLINFRVLLQRAS